MQWTETINKIIDYIEANLASKIETSNIAKIAGASFYNVQRVFVFVFNMTIMEYIRYRRLSLAALELVESNVKILDIAFKYGYSSNESFSRAFLQFHGILPSDARENFVKLKYCYRAEIEITAKAVVKIGKLKDLSVHHILNQIKIQNTYEIPFSALFPNEHAGIVRRDNDIMTMTCDNDKFFLATKKSFSLPLQIDLTAKTDSKNLKLIFGQGDLTLNWQYSNWNYKIDELMIHDIMTNECFGYPKKGFIKQDTFIHISWIMTKNYMALILDEELRYYNEYLPYIIQLHKNNDEFYSEVGIAPAWGSTVTLKQLCVHELEE